MQHIVMTVALMQQFDNRSVDALLEQWPGYALERGGCRAAGHLDGDEHAGSCLRDMGAALVQPPPDMAAERWRIYAVRKLATAHECASEELTFAPWCRRHACPCFAGGKIF